MNPQPSWVDLQPYYRESYQPYSPGSEIDDDSEIEKAKQTGSYRHVDLPIGKRLLDVGCGGGKFLRICKKLGAIEQGIEPSEHGAKAAQGQGLNVFHGTIEQFAEQRSDKFDLITANHVIEHVPDPIRTLSVMRELLAPGGLIWIGVPNAAYPIAKALKGYWHSNDLPLHLMQFSPSSISEAGRRAGLRVRKQKTESIPLIAGYSIGQYLRYKWKLPRRATSKLLPIKLIANWYAQRMDARTSGEAVITEFVAG
jgi:SAM-dependent methyltransferase